jgi:hypothetical protein
MQLEYHLISTHLEQSNMVNRGGLPSVVDLRQAKVNALREVTPTVPPSAGHLPPRGEEGRGWIEAVHFG